MWTALKCIIWPSLRYPLSITTLTESQLHQATSRLYPKLGSNWNYPLALQYALPLHQGLGLPHLAWEQGIMSIKLFLEHATSSCMESTLITTSLEYTQLQIGSSLPVFNTNFTKWGFLAEPTWFTSIWEFVSTHQIYLQSPTHCLPDPPRVNDRCIMDIAMESGLPPPALQAINKCHIAHQALFLSDITTGWGD